MCLQGCVRGCLGWVLQTIPGQSRSRALKIIHPGTSSASMKGAHDHVTEGLFWQCCSAAFFLVGLEGQQSTAASRRGGGGGGFAVLRPVGAGTILSVSIAFWRGGLTPTAGEGGGGF